MVGEEQNLINRGSVVRGESNVHNDVWEPVQSLKRLASASELHWSYLFGVVSVYGINQGLGGSLEGVATEYYMKDVQNVQPSESVSLTAITRIPWIIKPLWGLLTDLLPISGFHRRPYFILAGVFGVVSLLFISLHSDLRLYLALFLMTISKAAMAISDVTIDACTASNSIKHKTNYPSLTSDMWYLSNLSSSIGEVLGFYMSGILVHLVGSKGAFGLLTFPFGLLVVVGMVFDEERDSNFSIRQVPEKVTDAGIAIWRTMKCAEVWQPSAYMYISLALGLNIHECLFYWFTDSKDGPLFPQETVGFISAFGSVGSILGLMLYQIVLKDHSFLRICLWTQILFALSGMLDLILVLRLNLRFGLPDYLFIVVDEMVFRMINKLKWMLLSVLATKLCPQGIEGTFFALLMSIDNAGNMTSSWLGGVLLRSLKLTRTEFGNLWLAVLIRNVIRLLPLCVLFLVPKGNQQTFKLQDEIMDGIGKDKAEDNNLEMTSLIGQSVDRS